jgi:hypothetical protein
VRKLFSLNYLVDAYIRRIVPTRIIYSVVRDVTRTCLLCTLHLPDDYQISRIDEAFSR